ncbi:MAG: AAA family ATPase, partial [Firmicutes bacterium]|nr:AAA family ATPase [Bacillota bacterium]
SFGFRPVRDEAERSYETMKTTVMEELKRTFRPEFLNRIDEIIVFHALTERDLGEIVDLMLKRLAERLRETQLELEVSETARAKLVKEGLDPIFGARPLRRAIQRLVEDPLSEEMLRGNFGPGDRVLVEADEEGKLAFRKANPVA